MNKAEESGQAADSDSQEQSQGSRQVAGRKLDVDIQESIVENSLDSRQVQVWQLTRKSIARFVNLELH